jgi:hypothetical protein
MAAYSIRLVDHTGSSSDVTQPICNALKGFFDRVFSGTGDSASVAWGSGARSDTMVLHFVDDVASSYIRQTMKRPPTINPLAGGHTTFRSPVICSEFYKTVTIRGKTRTLSGLQYAKLAFHECFHNTYPMWTEDDLKGHGGLADTPVGPDLNERDVRLMRRGMAVPANYSQQL